MKLVNLTPHSIALHLPTGEVLTLPSSGVARVATLPREEQSFPGLPVPVLSAPVWGQVEGLPSPVEGMIYLVSGVVLEALRGSGRGDVFAPATGPGDGAIRDAQGRVAGVTRLIACG